MAIYMKYAGIEGASTTKGLEKWIVVDSFQYGVNRSMTSPSRASLSREASEVNISEIVITKQMDKSSPKLWQEAVGGVLDSKVEFKFTTAAKGETTIYAHFTLDDCGISAYSMSSGADTKPTESLSINFTKITWSYTPTDEKASGTPEKVGWNLATQQKV